jgi:hypothetical protein
MAARNVHSNNGIHFDSGIQFLSFSNGHRQINVIYKRKPFINERYTRRQLTYSERTDKYCY